MRVPLPALFFVAVAAARLPVLLAHLDTWYPFEVHCGTIALAFRDGLDVDWGTLPIVSHARGNVVFGLLLWPLYAVFGASSLTMKLLPLLWHAVTAALLVRLLERRVNRCAAVAAGVLLLCAPPSIQKLSVLGIASHLESTLPFVLALGAWLRLTDSPRPRPRDAFLFGAAVGFAAFFHVQALLPCLVLVGLLLAAEAPALGLRGVLSLLLGAVLFASPSLAFEGGGLGMIQASLAGDDEAVDAGGPSPIGKVLGLFRGASPGSLAGSFEYGNVAGGAGGLLALLAASALLLLPLLAVVLHRRRLADLLARIVLRRAGSPPGPVPPLALYALLLVAAFAVSHATLVSNPGTGAANRYIAPLVFTLIVLAAIAVGTLHAAGRRRTAAALLVLAALPGALGLPACVRAAHAARIPQRGECYEWFHKQLVQASGGRETPATVDLIDRVDRGDPLFRTLRFRVNLVRTPLDDPRLLEQEQVLRSRLRPEAALFSLTFLGRLLVTQIRSAAPGQADVPVMRGKDFWRAVEAMDEVEAAALLHGAGLALIPPPRLMQEDEERIDTHMRGLGALLLSFPPRSALAAAEGYGFAIGQVFDPYNLATRLLVTAQARLPEELVDAVYTGIGWGARQRCLTPPTAVPEGLVIHQCVPEAQRPAFTRGYTGEVLPAEAAVLRG